MDATERLASLVVARRVQLGYKRRPPFAEAAGIGLRTLGDIEAGRRSNYDPATLAAIENTLGWQTGSIKHILDGGEPTLARTDAAEAATAPSERDQLVIKIMARDDITDADKQKIVELLIAQREAAERAREESARRLVDMLRRNPDG